jgi:hypothetical protein
MSQKTEYRRLPAVTAAQMECLAASAMRFAGTIIDDDAFADSEKIEAYFHARSFINDVMRYTARYYLEAPDLIELHVGLQMLRNMLAERGIVRRDDDRGDWCRDRSNL